MKILFLSLALLSSSLWAADRSISDLMYLPKAKTFFGVSQLSILRGDFEATYSGTKYKSEYESTRFTQTVGFSVLDNLSVSLQMNYLDFEDQETTGTKEKSTNKGLSDPRLGAKFRALESNIILDFTSNLLISASDRVNEDSEINNKAGGHELTLGAEVGQKISSTEWVTFVNFFRIFESTTQNEDPIQDRKRDAHNAYQVGLALQQKITEAGFIRAFGEVYVKDEVDSNLSTLPASTLYTLGVGYRHLISQNLILGATIQRDDFHAGDVDSDQATTVKIAATYQF